MRHLQSKAFGWSPIGAYTAGHSDRVSAISAILAEAMGLPPEQVEIIRIGAKLHDIGKIGVPDSVLRKPGTLTLEELELIKLHPQIGKRILEKVERFEEYLPIVELHHENHDGSGYPYGLKGEEIPLGVRIVHVVDVYDAITSDRAYRKAMAEERVWEIMVNGAGKEFDPAVVNVFLQFFVNGRLSIVGAQQGGGRGAAIGAGTGAVAGALIGTAAGGKDLVLENGARLELQLDRPLLLSR